MCMTMEGDMAVPLSPFIEAHHLRKGRSAKAPTMHAIGGWADGAGQPT
jgi:hypothetical protein